MITLYSQTLTLCPHYSRANIPTLSHDHHMTRSLQVNFSVQDGVPEDKFRAVLRRSGGSMEVMTSQDDAAEPSYKLVPR